MGSESGTFKVGAAFAGAVVDPTAPAGEDHFPTEPLAPVPEESQENTADGKTSPKANKKGDKKHHKHHKKHKSPEKSKTVDDEKAAAKK